MSGKLIKPPRRKLASAAQLIDPAAGFSIKITDIYEKDDVVFPKVKAAGMKCCIMRAHFGTTPDTKHNEYAASTRAQGMGIGSYGFILPSQNIAEQVAIAVSAVKAVGGYKPGDVRFWADVEGEKAWKKVPGLTAAQRNRMREEALKAQVEAWLRVGASDNKRVDIILNYIHGVRDGISSLPGIYSSAHFLTAIIPDPSALAQLKNLMYWVAHYKISAPDVQEPFKSNNPPWHLWQSAEDAVIDGINGGGKKADLNVFFGSQADFSRLFG